MAISINSNQITSSINGFATFFGLNPFYFNFLDPSCLYPVTDICLEFWSQNTYNSTNGLSIELLSQLLYEAELEIMTYYGLSLGAWIVNERHNYPIELRHGNYIVPYIHDVVFKTKYKIDYFGQRKFTPVATTNLTYVDNDSDTYSEAARITYTIPTGKSIEDIKFYYPNHLGESNYEIKDYRLISLTNDVAVFEFDAWNLVSLSTLTSTKFKNTKAHSLCNPAIYLSTIGIGFEEKDSCLPDIKLFYKEDACIINCDYDNVPACGIKVSDNLFKLALQSYDTETGCVIIDTPTEIDLCQRIDYIEVNYHTSSDNSYLLQHAIYYLAASRFPLQNCQCDCIKNIFGTLQKDTRFKEKNAGNYNTFNTDQRSPFGTRIGELKAYNILENII
jgi:hypothetical protein